MIAELSKAIGRLLIGNPEKPRPVGLVILILLVAALARVGIFGVESKRVMTVVLPWELPGIDEPLETPIAVFGFRAFRNGIEVKAVPGGTYATGDRIELLIHFPKPVYAMVAGVDSKRSFKRVPLKHDVAMYFAATQDLLPVDIFILDSTEGVEVYYLITAAEPFSYKEIIEPALENIGNTLHRGPDGRWDIDLPSELRAYHLTIVNVGTIK